MKNILISLFLFLCSITHSMDQYIFTCNLPLDLQQNTKRPLRRSDIKIPHINIPFNIPLSEEKTIEPKKPTLQKKLSYVDKETIKKAEMYEKLLYIGIDSIAALKHRKQKIETLITPNRRYNIDKIERMLLDKELELITSFLAKYGIADLECIQQASTREAMAYYKCMSLKTGLDPKLVEAAYNHIKNRKDYLECLKEEPQSTSQTADLITIPILNSVNNTIIQSTIFPDYDLNHPLNQKYSALLEIVKLEHPETFGEYQSALDPILKAIHIIDPNDFESSSQTMNYAIQQYFHHLQPTNPLNHPKEFLIDTAKYVGWWMVNMASGNVLLSIEKAGLILSQIHELTSIDYSHLSYKERIDVIAQQAAEITKMILSEKLIKRLPQTKYYFKKHSDILKTPLEHSQAVTPDGVILPVQKIDEVELQFQDNANNQNIKNNQYLANFGNKTINDLIKNAKPGRETLGPTVQYELEGGFQKALEDFTALGPRDIRDVSNEIGCKKIGVLQNGTKVIVREYSKGFNKNGPPTLEIQISKNKIIKFRYR